MKKFQFKIIKKTSKCKARVGVIKTVHGEINTPAFVPVATLGTVKSLSPEELDMLNCEVILSNTYHLYLRPGDLNIKKFKGLHKFISWKKPLITDSGGFQVFSLGLSLKNKTEVKNKLMTKINDDGVIFHSHLDGSIHHFTPEKSISIQENLGSDIALVFDHCPPYPATYEYVKQAIERTYLWANRCQAVSNPKLSQVKYGVIQGGVFEDLRIKSAKQIVSLNFEGYAIGGIAVGENKKEMYSAVKWVNPHLPEEKPVHLLGVGEIDDLINLVSWGIDTFDCVFPTRIARMGYFLTKEKSIFNQKKFQANIFKSNFSIDQKPLTSDCFCYACKNFTRAYLHHLFRNEELLGYRLMTIHNLSFIFSLMTEIRSAILDDNLGHLAKKWLLN